MKVAYTIWTWGLRDGADFEQGLKECADLGYAAVENFSRLVPLYEGQEASLLALLRQYQLDLVALYQGLKEDPKADVEMAQRCITFLKRIGSRTLNIEAPKRHMVPEGEAGLKQTAARLDEIGQMAHAQGIDLCLHPHFGTNVEQAHELAYVMNAVSPEVLSLCLDTGHTVLGGMDPVATFRQYGERLKYVHFKDISDEPFNPERWNFSFRELGEGVVDFPGVAAALREAHYDGVICVELDRPRVCNYKSAMISRAYLRRVLGW